MLGVAQRRRGDPAAAVAAYRQALRLNPRDVEGWLQLAECLRQQRQPAAAIEAVGQALALNPDHPRAHTLAAALQQDKDT
jgi:cytochrome c-type biogenesis protein CcmH/NrfG